MHQKQHSKPVYVNKHAVVLVDFCRRLMVWFGVVAGAADTHELANRHVQESASRVRWWLACLR